MTEGEFSLGSGLAPFNYSVRAPARASGRIGSRPELAVSRPKYDTSEMDN